MAPFDTPPETEPDPKTRRIRRFKRIPLRFLLPNLITLLALCLGITAIRLGIEGRFELAVGSVIVATVLDALDGRVARMLKGASQFGAELDSLADFINFGVTPAVLIYIWVLHEMKSLGWVVALSIAVAMALRLARFNVALEDPDQPKWAKKFFTGIPAPAGAALVMLPMYLGFLGVFTDRASVAPAILIYTAVVAFLVISKIPTFSGKGFGKRIDRDLVLPMLAGSVLFTVLLISFPWQVLTAGVVIYLVMLPVGWRSFKRHQANDLKKSDA